jgi:hypothetical protein
MRHAEAVGARSIGGDQQPPRASLLDSMHAVAGGGLRGDFAQELRVSQKSALKLRKIVNDREENLRVQNEEGPFDLTNPPVPCGEHTVEEGRADKAFSPDGRRFNRRSILKDDDEGSHPRERKVDQLDLVALVEELLPNGVRNLLGSLDESLELTRGELRQNSVTR